MLNFFQISIIQSDPVTPGKIKGHRCGKKPERRSHTGQRGHENTRRTDLFSEAIGMHRSGTAKSGYGDNVRIAAFFGNMGFGCGRHGFVDQIMDSKSGFHDRCSKGSGNFGFHGALRSPLVEQHGSTQKIVRIQISQQQIGIGHRGIFSPVPVTSRTRISPRTFRPHLQKTHFAHFGNAAAAGPDFH